MLILHLSASFVTLWIHIKTPTNIVFVLVCWHVELVKENSVCHTVCSNLNTMFCWPAVATAVRLSSRNSIASYFSVLLQENASWLRASKAPERIVYGEQAQRIIRLIWLYISLPTYYFVHVYLRHFLCAYRLWARTCVIHCCSCLWCSLTTHTHTHTAASSLSWRLDVGVCMCFVCSVRYFARGCLICVSCMEKSYTWLIYTWLHWLRELGRGYFQCVALIVELWRVGCLYNLMDAFVRYNFFPDLATRHVRELFMALNRTGGFDYGIRI